MISQTSFPMTGMTSIASLALSLLGVLGGCDSPSSESTGGDASVLIQYQGQPIADIMVRLHGEPNGPPLTQAVTNVRGNASLSSLPSPEPAKYFVSLESVSDGGWILDSRVIERSGVDLELSPFSEQPVQKIELPPQSVKPL